MTDSLEAIRAEIAEHRDAAAAAQARLAQIDAAVEALREERRGLMDEPALHAERIRALERAEAVLIEHSAPAPAAPDPEPAPEPPTAPAPEPRTPARQRIRDELRDLARSRHEAEEASAPRPAGTATAPKPPIERPAPAPRRQPRDGLTVHPKTGVSTPRPKSDGVHKIGEGAYARDLPYMLSSPEWAQRADLVVDLMKDRGGEATGVELRDDVATMLECEPATAQTIVSRSLAVLYERGRVVDTGEKGPDAIGRNTSSIWKIKQEEAS